MAEEHAHEQCGVSRLLATELRHHVPFTALGALSGIVVMAAFILLEIPQKPAEVIFELLHPAHVLLSAIVTTALYRRYRPCRAAAAVVGFAGSVGLGTLSDIVFPYLGGLAIGAHMDHIHLAFIEEWWLVNPAALVGVGIGLWRQGTRLPHWGHVFVSTWASLFYLASYGGDTNWLPKLPLIFVLLFVAVWLPCCLSDIVFPLLIAGKKAAMEHEHQH